MPDQEKDKDTSSEMREEAQGAPEHTEEKQPASLLPEPGHVRLGRRNFIGKALVGCGAAVGLELGYAGFKMMATKPVGEKKPVKLSLSQLPVGSRTTVIYGGEKIEVVRSEKGVRAMSMVCTHLGCLVIWQENDNNYHCPCHDAYFDENGNVISGPPTQPLEKIPVTVSGNTVTIGV